MNRLANGEPKGNLSRRIIEIKGIVQGVGFRPFIFQIAKRYGLHGWVLNTSGGVLIEVEGEEESLHAFLDDLTMQLPPLARIETISVIEAEAAGYQDFKIRQSQAQLGEYISISPDVGTCAGCQRELMDITDHRYGYPFINCTNCGPRFSIITDIPYDRQYTSMQHFQMCDTCAQEYEDPDDRRFHAQPNACAQCGPLLNFIGGTPLQVINGDVIKLTVHALQEGKIVAVKGLGGFHLACDAADETAVTKLRLRKHRYGKAMAVMMKDLEQLARYCELSAAEEKLLMSPRRPIVILQQRKGAKLAPSVTQGLPTLGVMLPYTPLHFLLLANYQQPLVMTSGNISEEPLVSSNVEALEKLGGIADCFLMHNRDVINKIDDSLTRVIASREAVIRRARGYAPEPMLLPEQLPEILGCGPEQKNTFCLTRDNHAFVSQHIGDLDNLPTLEYYERMIAFYKQIFRINPRIVAYDLHPAYLSTQYAKSIGNVQLLGVQHHHAHIVSCMLENGITDQVIGIACDGTGFGTDGNLWGGEFLLADYRSFTRLGHFKYVRMPGGEKAIKEPYRMAYGYLYSLFGKGANAFPKYIESIEADELLLMEQQMYKHLYAPLTSSCARLFDAVSAIINIARIARYEGEAAIRLESIIDERVIDYYDFDLQEYILNPAPILQGVYDDLENDIAPSTIAAKFHNTLTNAITKVCREISNLTGVKKVCLSGGVFQNAYLLKGLVKHLTKEGFRVFWQQKVPANDGGISLGQVMIAHYNVSK
ncbi:MAG: carbamoyltransferase HypF [Desulfotomaculaceae bacterium]|nr:carbamoyltransferase HypF [Desulfotomaculaceae bacterium]